MQLINPYLIKECRMKAVHFAYQHRWLMAWLITAVLTILFFMQVIYPSVKPLISPTVIKLEKENYPELRAVIKSIADTRSGRTVIDIEYYHQGLYPVLYRCICSGYLCRIKHKEAAAKPKQTKNGETPGVEIPVKWIAVQPIHFSNRKNKIPYCAIYQTELIYQDYYYSHKMPFEHGNTTVSQLHTINSSSTKQIVAVSLNPEIKEFHTRAKFMAYLTVAYIVLIVKLMALMLKKFSFG